jgi:hypothetical protein
MRRFVVLACLVLSFVIPLVVPAAQAGESGAVQARSSSTSCKRRRAKKPSPDGKKKAKKNKKPYGFEL